jgi:hypothetical protein
MSDDEGRRAGGHEEEADEVEAHGRHAGANVEAGDEAKDDNDVEAHMRRAAPDADGGRTG